MVMLAWRRLHYHDSCTKPKCHITTTETCVKIENHHVLLCTIMYPTSVFELLSPKKNWHGSWKSLFERKIKSSSKPIFGFHVSFRGGVDIIVGIVKFNFVACNSTPSNGRQSTGLEKKGKTPTFHDRLILEGWMDVKYLRLRGDFEGM